MMKVKHIVPVIFFSAFLSGGILGAIGYRYYKSYHTKSRKARAKLEQLLTIIDKEYVDAVNTDSIVEFTANHILSQLDPFSTYIPKEELKEVQEVMKGSFSGIGINYYMYRDTLAIVKVLEGGPAAKAGLKAGDRILGVDGNKVIGSRISNDSVVNLIKGKKNSKIELEIYRKLSNNLQNIIVQRGDVPIKSVDAALMINDTIGYIKINRFAETTFQEFLKESKKIKAETPYIILDLKDNGGGYMEPAIEIANQFLSKGTVIVKTIDKRGEERITLASSDGKFQDKKLYVLINENTASASEIIAGAIQDNDRGVIIGKRSFGKGLVQREITLSDGSVVRLTTARYYTPSGRSIQKPYDEQTRYNHRFNERFVEGQLSQEDTAYVEKSMVYRTKNNRVIYGGGGIVPDIFVKQNNSHSAEAVQLLMKTSLVSYFVFEEIEKNRSFLESLSVQELAEEIASVPEYYQNLKTHLIQSGFSFDLDKHKNEIIFYLISEYIYQLLPTQDYYLWDTMGDEYVKKILSGTIDYNKVLH